MGAVQFGPYRLERLLGKGGMGEVWLAATSTGTRVAVKLLAAEHARDADYRTRFTREAELAATLRDPHIVPIHAHGAIDGRLFIEMAFVEGTDLAGQVARGPLPVGTAIDIIGQIAGALDTAHRVGLVHRDIKPSNILVRPDGFAYLIDFGLARSLGASTLTATGMAIGTLAYMAPERFTGTADGRADIYALACVLYECLTGARPFGDTDAAQQMHAHLMAAPPRARARNSAIPAALDEVIARGLAKDPDDRYATAGEFAAAAVLAKDGRRAHHPTKRLPVVGPHPTRVETRVQTKIAGAAVAAPGAEVSSGPSAVGRTQASREDESARSAAVEPERRWYLRRRAAAPRPVGPAQQVRPAPPVQAALPGTGARPAQVVQLGRPTAAGSSAAVRPGTALPAAVGRAAAARPGTASPPAASGRPSTPVRQRGQRWPSRGPGYAPPARPPARRRKRGIIRKTIYALIALCLAPFALAAGCFAVLASSSDTGSGGATVANPPGISEPGPEPEPGPEIAPAGSAVRDGKFEFEVTGVESGVPKVGSQRATGSFLIVTLTVRNIADEAKWFTPFGQKLFDSAGNQLDPHLLATFLQGNGKHRNTIKLEPGESATGKLVFDIPDSVTPSRLALHDSPFSGGASIALG
ncbi:protein kinase [Nocardia sp. NPDC048505]|uniref:serine/threonine-protein kinase n=1 Tax=unclassified Nocardia TaxID=2637762 RepID=UPI0033C806B7